MDGWTEEWGVGGWVRCWPHCGPWRYKADQDGQAPRSASLTDMWRETSHAQSHWWLMSVTVVHTGYLYSKPGFALLDSSGPQVQQCLRRPNLLGNCKTIWTQWNNKNAMILKHSREFAKPKRLKMQISIRCNILTLLKQPYSFLSLLFAEVFLTFKNNFKLEFFTSQSFQRKHRSFPGIASNPELNK